MTGRSPLPQSGWRASCAPLRIVERVTKGVEVGHWVEQGCHSCKAKHEVTRCRTPGKPDAYEELLALLAVHPIKTWACAKARIARASFYAKLDRDPEYACRVERAMAAGRGH